MNNNKSILFLGFAGFEGSAIIAEKNKEDLITHFPVHMVENTVDAFKEYQSIFDKDEIKKLLLSDDVCLLGEGGIFSALWALGEKTKRGFKVELSCVPVMQETVEICEYYDLNPYRLLSGNSILLLSEDIFKLTKLYDSFLPVVKIGELTDSLGRCVCYDENMMYLTAHNNDELYKVIKG